MLALHKQKLHFLPETKKIDRPFENKRAANINLKGASVDEVTLR